MNLEIYERLFAITAFIVGAIVGSFLNVCIYRMPIGLSVNEPKRSFCPQCKTQIPWYRNIPMFSWLLLRGKCANCKCFISPRYLLVEALTGFLFLAVFLRFPLVEVLPYWILLGLLLVATFIDIDHFIIPDEITWGGVVAGLVCSVAAPSLMQVDSRLAAFGWSLLGAVVGYGSLWGVVELGKLAFGRKRIVLEREEAFTFRAEEADAVLTIGDEELRWSEVFSRESDRLVLELGKSESATLSSQPIEAEALVFFHDRLEISGKSHPLEELVDLKGQAQAVVIPREAMGFGDVKFIAAIGAFLGWKAVFFTICMASILGSIVGITAILVGRREWSAKIPFGPYLAAGAAFWLFYGTGILDWYLALMRGGYY